MATCRFNVTLFTRNMFSPLHAHTPAADLGTVSSESSLTQTQDSLSEFLSLDLQVIEGAGESESDSDSESHYALALAS